MKTLLERIVVNFLRKPKEPPVVPKKTLLERIAVEFLGEEDSPATQQAKQMGLVYKQFGRWADPTTDKITHKSADDGAKLVPWTAEDEEERKEKDGEETPADDTADDAEKDDKDTPSDDDLTQAAKDARQSIDQEEYDELSARLGGISVEMETVATERREGQGGAGGAVASYGELIGTEVGNAMRSAGGVFAHIEGVREADEESFDARVATIAENGIAPSDHPFGERWPPEGTHGATKSAAIRRRDTLGKALFAEGYDSGSADHKECVAKYAAARQIHTEEVLEEAKGPPPLPIFAGKGSTGFGENDQGLREWADAAYDAGTIQQRKVETGRTSIDPTRPYMHVQSTSVKLTSTKDKGKPDPDRAQTDDMTKERLQEGLDGASGEDKEYYEDQLEKFKKLDHHDTYVVGYDEQGRTNVYHISNKKSDSMAEPHRNGTPKNALKQLRDKLTGVVGKVAPEVTKVIEEGIERLGDAQQGSARACMELETDGDEGAELVALIDSYDSPDGSPSKYKEALYTAAEKPPSGKPDASSGDTRSFSQWLSDQDITKLREMSTEDLLKTTQGFMQSRADANKKITYDPFAKIFMKAGEGAIKKKRKDSNYDHPTAEIKITEKQGVEAAYQGVTSAIAKADKDLGFSPDGEVNGPHTQAYIEFQLNALHYDTYIMNYDDSAGVEMGIYDASPADFRESLAELVGFEGNLDTEDSRKKLLQVLAEQGRIDTTSQSIVLKTPEGAEHVLALDTWRTAGTSPKVATFLGKEVREKLTVRAQARNAEMFEDFCPAIGKSKAKLNASVRPLLRSLIIRELDRIKNGN
jgi:hypothetical protein